MKKCVKCGREIVNGVNGCQMMDECFECHGGYPDYSRNKFIFHWSKANWDNLDALEDRCIRDYDD